MIYLLDVIIVLFKNMKNMLVLRLILEYYLQKYLGMMR